MKKILIVEDEISFRNLLHRELASKEYSVVDAKDGKEGYEMALRFLPDLVILDVFLPGMDGLTMLEQLRATKEGKTMKVIILTNLELDNENMQRTLSLKPLYFLVKTEVSLSGLLDKVDEEFLYIT